MLRHNFIPRMALSERLVLFGMIGASEMTVTVSILNLGNSVPVDVATLKAADTTLLVPVDTSTNGKGERETLYQQSTGDKEFPLTARVGVYPNALADNGIGRTNFSTRVASFLQKVDDGDVEWTKPCHITIAGSMPGMTAIPDNDDVEEMLSLAFSLVLPVIAGIISQAALDDLSFGITTNVAAHPNSASA